MKKIGSSILKMILNEFDFAIDKMEKSTDPIEQLFYFSAIPSAINRAFNIEFNGNLVFVQHILTATHQGMMSRIDLIKRGDATVPITKNQMDVLLTLCKDLKKAFAEETDFVITLTKFVLLLYSTSGNGYYLTQKGTLKI